MDKLACNHMEYHGTVHFGCKGELNSLQQQLVNAMKSEVELLADMGVRGTVIPANAPGPSMESSMQSFDMGVLGRIVPPNVKDLSMESSMQRFVVPTDWIFMTNYKGGNFSHKVLLDNQANLHVFKNGSLVSNI